MDQQPMTSKVEKQMKPVSEILMRPKSGLALKLSAGDHLRITDLEGHQVVEVAIFNLHNVAEVLSTSYSRARQPPKDSGTYFALEALTEGHVLVSTVSKPLMTIVADTQEQKGVHAIASRMCDRTLYELHGLPGQDGCLEQMATALAPHGLGPEQIPDTLGLFHNYRYDTDAKGWVTAEPVNKPGDYVELRAEKDVLVALSNCPDDVLTLTNARKCGPTKVETFR